LAAAFTDVCQESVEDFNAFLAKLLHPVLIIECDAKNVC
jgi:hypothetical protein